MRRYGKLALQLLFLLKEGEKSPRELVERLKGSVPRHTVCVTLQRLKKAGLTNNPVHGCWFLTPDGEEYLEKMEYLVESLEE